MPRRRPPASAVTFTAAPAGSSQPAGNEQLLHEFRLLAAKVERFTQIVAPLATRRLSRAQQARAAGVHPSTLWRRERRASACVALELPARSPKTPAA